MSKIIEITAEWIIENYSISYQLFDDKIHIMTNEEGYKWINLALNSIIFEVFEYESEFLDFEFEFVMLISEINKIAPEIVNNFKIQNYE